MSKILIPTPLRKFTQNEAFVEVEATNVAQSIDQLVSKFPDVKRHILDEGGKIRNFVRVYVGDEDIQALEGEATPIAANETISIIPAIAGGSGNKN
jgi:molybdopterin converting factor small subunit